MIKRFIVVALIAFSFLSFKAYHKYYVSLTEVTYNKDASSFEVSTKVFYDDLEAVLYELHGKKLKDDGSEESKKMISDYILANLKIKVNGEPTTLKVLGTDDELDAIWIHLEVKDLPETVNSVTIKNAVLTEFYPQQSNIVNFFPVKSNTKKVKGLLLNKNKLENTIKLK